MPNLDLGLRCPCEQQLAVAVVAAAGCHELACGWFYSAERIVTNLALSLGMSGAHDNPDMPTQP